MKIEHTTSPEESEKIVDLLLNGSSLYENKPIFLTYKDKEIIENTKPLSKRLENTNSISKRLEEGKEALKKFKANQTLPYGNKWYKEYSKKPTLKNSKIGDVILYKGELLINTGAEIIPFTLKKENNMENYIVINGKKAELTEEQLKALGIEVEKKRNNPFNSKIECVDNFYYIRDDGIVNKEIYLDSCEEEDKEYMKKYINIVNSFNDKAFANQVYLHELLNRKLLKYSYDHESEDCEWDINTEHYCIYFDFLNNLWDVDCVNLMKKHGVYFSKATVARQAIKDVIEPFIEEHPEFVW